MNFDFHCAAKIFVVKLQTLNVFIFRLTVDEFVLK